MRTKNVLQGALLSAGLCVAATTAMPSLASAQGDAKAQAEALNTEGKALIKQLDLKGAAAKFREALALSDDPRFAFNLCYTLEKSGVLKEAKAACERALAASDSRLQDKANRLLASIEERLPPEPAEPPNAKPPIPAEPVVEPTPGPGPNPAPGGPGPGHQNSSQPPGPPPGPPPPSPKPVPEPHQPKFGVMFGLSRASMNTQLDNEEAVVGVALGGMVVVNRRRRFETVVDAQLVNRGFAIDAPGLFDATLVSTYADVTVTSRWLLGHGSTKPYLEAGATVSLLLGSSFEVDGVDSEGDIEGFDFGYTLGGGVRVALGRRELDLRLRYILGLLSATKARDVDGPGTGNSYNRALLIQGGLWF